MNRKQARWMPLAVAALAISWAGPARAQDTGQSVGQKLDEVGQDIKEGFKDLGQAAKRQFAKAKESVENMGVQARVYGRIHWDKALNDATIELTSTDDGVISMNGTVADAKAKQRAVELARETVGVTRVVDRLAVRPAPKPSP
ncbi:BON domain-containing protein [Tundrisphaera lichenicola]|uniref:BON domain-containing protein n=1 Tax=Tundrisphaera lichenicola TaxID=2029860 RepID=UPI003EC04706